jgi:DNA-binding response OmpR family regulator
MATRILVVDDSPTIRTVVSTILERNGYDPTIASDGQDAFDVLSSGEVKADLVLVDFVMPRMNGYQFMRALREHPELSSTPVVLMSAKADRIRDQFVQQTGAIDAITKPFDAQALVAVIENALRKVNTANWPKGASSTRLPDLDFDENTGITGLTIQARTEETSKIESDTKRTDIAKLIGEKLAAIVVRTLGELPETVSAADISAALTERLSNEAVLEMMAAMAEPKAKPKDEFLLAGDLGVVPIGAVLQLLQAENQTGVLVCTNGSIEIRATFREGEIDLVEASGAGVEFRLGRFFIEEGILTAEQIDDITQRTSLLPSTQPMPGTRTEEIEAPLSSVQMRGPDNGNGAIRVSLVPDTEVDRHGQVTMPGGAVIDALAAATQKPRPLGMALLAAGKIVESQLRSALMQQSNELLYEVLRWPIGRFELRREPPSELAQNAKLGMPVASAVMEGFRRVDEWRELERIIGSFDTVVLRDDAAFGKLDIASLPSKEKTVLDAVDGERTIRAIVAASHLSSFDVCRIVAQFLEARALRRRASRAE